MADIAEAKEQTFPLALSNITALLILAVVAVATRFVAIGNPVANPDDQFYLLVGDAMLNGQWPYIDIWDRKPFGLFALFAAIAGIGGSSILAMNLIALLFALATAMVVRSIALHYTGKKGALLAGAAYLLVLPLFSGQTAQAPVFFNLPMSLAALALVRAGGAEVAAVRRLALLAMLGCGLAISIKQVAAVEGAYFGLAFLWLMRRKGAALPSIAASAALMILVALLPTLIPLAVYAAAGPAHLEAFLHANFVSIFQKSSLGTGAQRAGLLYFLLFMGPLIAFALIGLVQRMRENAGIEGRLLLGWVVAAVLGYLAVPQFYDQYALPMIAPLAVAAAIAFDRSSGLLMFVALAVTCLLSGKITAWQANREAAATFEKVSKAAGDARRGGCILVNEGPVWLYQTTGACRLTPYLFPGHLNLVTEVDAVGIDTVTETKRILALRPAVITFQPSTANRHNPATELLVVAALRRDYQLVATVGPDATPSMATLQLWQRRDLGPAPTNVPDLSRATDVR